MEKNYIRVILLLAVTFQIRGHSLGRGKSYPPNGKFVLGNFNKTSTLPLVILVRYKSLYVASHI